MWLAVLVLKLALLFCAMICIYDHPPSYRTLSRCMLMVILRRELPLLFCNDLTPAAHTAVYTRMGRFRARRMIYRKGVIVILCQIAAVAVNGHGQGY